jgi:ring-1,2-phenylacetyl-CoA epoxidase subunit PaaD
MLPDARMVAESVADPELPQLTLADLGVLRAVEVAGEAVTVLITPTYSGCPAMGTIRDDLMRALHEAGYADVEVRTTLTPPWSTDWITPVGKAKLAAAGIAPPGPAPRHRSGPVPIALGSAAVPVRCPQCGCADTVEISRFSGTACKALRRCRACSEPFEHLKEI